MAKRVVLSDEQQAVIDVCEYLDENLMVIARAGTGKTTTCLAAIPKLSGVTWFCAYGKRIAVEIEQRADELGILEYGNVRVSTVHSGGRRILNRKYPIVKTDKFKVYNIVQEHAQKNRLFRFNGWRISKMVELAKQSGFGVLQGIYDETAWMRLIDHFGLDVGFGSQKARDWDPLIEAAQEVYVQSLAQCERGLIDFSDMLLAPLYFGCKMPKYNNIVIDEGQDISPLRLVLILGSLHPDGRIIAVGDPNQAIFGFTGSDDKAMETIRELTKANTLPLTVSRRCTRRAIARAQKLVPDIVAAEDAIDGLDVYAHLADDPTGASNALTIWDIHKQRSFNCDDVILCRNNRPLATMAFTMLRQHIPCYVEGREDGMGLVALIRKIVKESLAPVVHLDTLAAKVSDWRDVQVYHFESRKQNFKAAYVNDQAETVIYLSQVLKGEGYYSVESLVQTIDTMFKDTDESGKPKCITLSTIHKAKGKEWDRVFLLGMNKYMPSQFARQDWEKQQEANLEYVAVTRNRKEFIDVQDNTKGR